MPEVYSMSRWGKPNEYDGYKMPGDKYVHSIRHKQKKEREPRGCQKNDGGKHFWVCNKHMLKYDHQDRVFTSYETFCLLCSRPKRGLRHYRTRPPQTTECLTTTVVFVEWHYGAAHHDEHSYKGETDISGKPVDRYATK